MLITACNKKETADLIITNGKIITVDDDFSVDEAVAVRGDKIIFIGKNEEVKKYTGKSTRLINAEGLTVLPGLIDSHAHLISLGDQLYNLDISDCRSFDEVVAEVALRVDEVADGQWIKGGRWDHTRWRSAAFPVHDSLSSVSPDNPVYLDTYAWVLYKIGHYEDAEKYILEALDKGGSNDPEVNEHAGDIQMALGSYQMAMSYYRKAIILGGDSSEVQEKIDQIGENQH